MVMRALQRNREARYLTAGEMAEDLEKVLFEMRASPHEPRKLLISLFPQGPSRISAACGLRPSVTATSVRLLPYPSTTRSSSPPIVS